MAETTDPGATKKRVAEPAPPSVPEPLDAAEIEILSATSFPMSSLEQLETVSLSRTVLTHCPDDHALMEAIREASQGEGDFPDFVRALRPLPGEPIGRGSESVYFELPPTRLLLTDPAFRETLETELTDRKGLRERILSLMPMIDTDQFNILPMPRHHPSVEEQVAYIMDTLPERLVVRITNPEGGSWESDWGERECDVPILFKQQLDDGQHFLVVHEFLTPIDSPGAVEAILPKGYELSDPIGNNEQGESSGQAGTDRFGNRLVFDFGAVVPAGSDPDKLMMSSHAADMDERIAESERREEEGSLTAARLVEVTGDRHEALERALAGEGDFWSIETNRELLGQLAASVGESVPIPESEDVDTIIFMRAHELSTDGDYEPHLRTAQHEVAMVLDAAIAEGIFQTSAQPIDDW